MRHKRGKKKNKRLRTQDDVGAIISSAVREMMQVPAPCILCNELTHSRGVFTPDDPKEYGAPPDKHRAVVYALCEEDASDKKNFELVEKKIKGMMVLGNFAHYDL